MFNRITESLRRFMSGRYGVDQLTVAMLIVGMALSLSYSLLHWFVISIIYWVVVILCFCRILSRKIAKRQQENQMFMVFWAPLGQKLAGIPANLAQRKAYCLFKCPHCGQKLRLPRGRGMVEVTCHKCSTKFQKKT